ncbi:MAG: glutamine--fructose-6-phosphate transaminase (isomerizing) [archaeon]
MCGIVGMIGKGEFSIRADLLKAIKRLEYRGYDSIGFATAEGICSKDAGDIDSFTEKVDPSLMSSLAISHTRWATHGGVTAANAHPHFNADKTIFAVHNGIIENYAELKEGLEGRGYRFITQTDSEIIPHYFDDQLKRCDIREAMRNFIRDIRGTFAVILFRKGDSHLYALKRDSPLALGPCPDRFVLGSDIYAFSDRTDKAIFFEDNEYAVLDAEGYRFFNEAGVRVPKKKVKFEWTKRDTQKEKFDHFMIKEVHEQPATSERLIESLRMTYQDKLVAIAGMMKKASRVFFVACGTSYHASLVGVYLLRKLGITAHTVIASEFENFLMVNSDDIVVAISQSGETMDVVTVLKDVKKTGAKIVSFVNVPYSTIQRLSDVSLEILAGQEICVAATKSFTNQVIMMLELANQLGCRIEINDIPEKIAKTIADNEEKVKRYAERLYEKNDMFVLGRGMSYPIAREIALKLKEISYVHAEGMMGGELKHGTIALVEKGTPIIALIPNHCPDMVSNAKEVEARGADVIVISNVNGDFTVPPCDNAEFAIYACIIGHLLSYYIAKLRKLPIDKPRNLAKSVTVK